MRHDEAVFLTPVSASACLALMEATPFTHCVCGILWQLLWYMEAQHLSPPCNTWQVLTHPENQSECSGAKLTPTKAIHGNRCYLLAVWPLTMADYLHIMRLACGLWTPTKLTRAALGPLTPDWQPGGSCPRGDGGLTMIPHPWALSCTLVPSTKLHFTYKSVADLKWLPVHLKLCLKAAL